MEESSKRARKSKGPDTCNWTLAMDEVLIDAYLHQHTLGNKNGNSLTSFSMDNIFQELKTHFPDKPITKDKIKDHMKNIKAKFSPCYDIFKNGLSGFAWNKETNMWIAEDEVWESLIKVLYTLTEVSFCQVYMIIFFYVTLCLICEIVDKTYSC